jgi:hypothetical protein
MESHKIKVKSWVISMALATLSMFSTTSAHAADGCKFLLCIAGPWTTIPECRPTVYEVFRDLALGRSFPTCDMSGDGNNAGNAWTTEATCPIMYRRYDHEGYYSGCVYPGLISVYIEGSLWSQVYWNNRGETSTWYSDTARESLTQDGAAPLDDTFMNDVSTWNTQQVSACTAQGGTAVFGEFGAYVSCNLPDDRGGRGS